MPSASTKKGLSLQFAFEPEGGRGLLGRDVAVLAAAVVAVLVAVSVGLVVPACVVEAA
jgi:hypothetical protein